MSIPIQIRRVGCIRHLGGLWPTVDVRVRGMDLQISEVEGGLCILSPDEDQMMDDMDLAEALEISIEEVLGLHDELAALPGQAVNIMLQDISHGGDRLAIQLQELLR